MLIYKTKELTLCTHASCAVVMALGIHTILCIPLWYSENLRKDKINIFNINEI